MSVFARIPAWVMACFLVSMAAGCGSGGQTEDTGSDLGAEVADDVVVDTGHDAAQELTEDSRDTEAIDLDAATDDGGGLDATPDIAGDTTVVPEVFAWTAGCEGTGTGATWTKITDTTFPRGPLIQMSDRDTVTILWRTATPLTDQGCVDYGWGQGTLTECGDPDVNGQYEIALNNLPPATEITYSARVGEQKTTDLTFRTMPDRPMPMKIAVFGDAHNGEENLRKMADISLAEGVDFALANGDLTNQGLVEEFDQTFRGWQDLGSRVNIWAVIGNHDEKNIPTYFDSLAMPQGNVDEIASGQGEAWWARRIGNVWIGGGWIRDFYVSTPDSDWGEVGWFRKQFETPEFQTAQYRLFFIHQSPYSLQWDDECIFDGEDCLKVALVPLMKEFGLQASFHGHLHGIEYGVVDNVHVIVAGGLVGGGMDDEVCFAKEGYPDPWHKIYGIPNFSIVETACDGLKVRIVDLAGNDITSMTIPSVPIRYDENIRMLSFNLRLPFDSEPGKRWDDRKQLVLNVINEFAPDVMAIQEGYQHTQDFIKENLPHLDWVGLGRSASIVDEYSSIFYDKTKFELIETKTLALSDTPDVLGSMFDDQNQLYPRIVTWAHLRRLSDGFEFDAFSTHWDHTDVDGIRERMAVANLMFMNELSQGRPILLAGDFNCGYQSVPYNVMTGAAEWEGVTGGMTDTWTELGLAEEGTFHGFTGVARGDRIDWVLHNGGFKGVGAQIIQSSWEGVYPSDHFPIGAEFSITKP